MSRICELTGKGRQVGHNVSHSNIKTKRRFLPNLQTQSLLSDVLGPVRLRLSAAAIRTIEKNGGIDAFLRGTPDSRLSPEIRRLKRRIVTAAAARSAVASICAASPAYRQAHAASASMATAASGGACSAAPTSIA